VTKPAPSAKRAREGVVVNDVVATRGKDIDGRPVTWVGRVVAVAGDTATLRYYAEVPNSYRHYSCAAGETWQEPLVGLLLIEEGLLKPINAHTIEVTANLRALLSRVRRE
jgi:hypothetical protein